MSEQVQQFQQSDKTWKAMQLVGVLVMLAGAAMFFAANTGHFEADAAYGVAVLCIGAPIWFVGSLVGWWRHG